MTDAAHADADIAATDDTKRGYLRLSPKWMSFSDKHKTVIILHELLHLVTAPLCQAINTADMSAAQRTWVNKEEETMVDSLACALRPLMPQYPGSQTAQSTHVHLSTKHGI